MGRPLAEDLSKMLQVSARGSLILIGGQALSTLISALGVIVVARFLGPFSFGDVTIALIPVNILMLLNDWGVTSALVKYISQYRHEGKARDLRTLVRAGMVFNTGVGAGLSIALFALSGVLASQVFQRPELGLLIRVASMNILAQSLVNTSQSVFVGFERMELKSLTLVLHSVVKSFLAPLLVWLGYGPFGAVLGQTAPWLFTGMVGAFLVLLFFHRRVKDESTLSARQAVRLFLGYGYPLFLSTVMTGGLGQFYGFLMALYVGADLIGNYSAATNFAVLVGFFTMPISTVLFPLFSKIGDENRGRLVFVFQNSVKYSALITLPVTAALVAFSDHLVRIVYGGLYQLASLYMSVFLLNSLFIGLGGLSVGNLINGRGETKVTFRITLISICLGLPLSVLLIPRFGIMGLLATTIIAPKPGLLYGLLWVNRNLGFTIDWKSSAKIYLSTGVAFAASLLYLRAVNLGAWVELLSGGVLFLLIYSLIVTLTGAVKVEDVVNVRSITRAFGPLASVFNLFLSLVEVFMRALGRR